MKGTIKIISQDIAMCPSLFSVILSDGSKARIEYRFGILSLILNEGKGFNDKLIEQCDYPKEADGYIEIEEAVSWLIGIGYDVDTSEFVDLTECVNYDA